MESCENEERPSESVLSGFVGMETQTCGAENTECILAIVPVQVTAYFCTKELMEELNLTDRKTHILLKTVGEKRVVVT